MSKSFPELLESLQRNASNVAAEVWGDTDGAGADAGADVALGVAVGVVRVGKFLDVQALMAEVAYARACPLMGYDADGVVFGPLVESDGRPFRDEFDGERAPVDSTAVTRWAAATGMSEQWAMYRFCTALELADRLPLTYAAVCKGVYPVHTARQLAGETDGLSLEVVAWLDERVARGGVRLTKKNMRALIAEGQAKFAPAPDLEEFGGSWGICEYNSVTLDGSKEILVRADVVDVDRFTACVTAIAEQLRANELQANGEPRARGVLMSEALGVMVDRATTGWNPHAPDELGSVATAFGVPTPVTVPVHVTVHVHADETIPATVTGARGGVSGPVLTQAVARWVGRANRPADRVTITPVIDAAAYMSSDSYQPKPALRQLIQLRDRTCVFPGCDTPATRCDLDHTIPHAHGGATDTGNLAALCRKHHRGKTHGLLSYAQYPGGFVWRGQTGYLAIRDRAGRVIILDHAVEHGATHNGTAERGDVTVIPADLPRFVEEAAVWNDHANALHRTRKRRAREQARRAHRTRNGDRYSARYGEPDPWDTGPLNQPNPYNQPDQGKHWGARFPDEPPF